jgi:N-methylhydantoinase A
VNFRIQAIGVVPRVGLPTVPEAVGPVEAAVVGARRAFFPGSHAVLHDTPVYDRSRLRGGHRFTGPAIVEQYDSTVIVFPEQTAEVDRYGNLMITHREGE